MKTPMADVVERLRERAESYREGGPSSEHTAAMLDEAAREIEALRKNETELRDSMNALLDERALSQAGAGGVVVSTEPTCWTSEVSLRMAAEGVPAVIHAYPPPVEPVALYRAPPAPVQTASVEAVEPEMMEALYDKIEGLEADLESAVEVAFRRGAVEWTRLNYPTIYARLNAASLTAPTQGDGGELEQSECGFPFCSCAKRGVCAHAKEGQTNG